MSTQEATSQFLHAPSQVPMRAPSDQGIYLVYQDSQFAVLTAALLPLLAQADHMSGVIPRKSLLLRS